MFAIDDCIMIIIVDIFFIFREKPELMDLLEKKYFLCGIISFVKNQSVQELLTQSTFSWWKKRHFAIDL